MRENLSQKPAGGTFQSQSKPYYYPIANEDLDDWLVEEFRKDFPSNTDTEDRISFAAMENLPTAFGDLRYRHRVLKRKKRPLSGIRYRKVNRQYYSLPDHVKPPPSIPLSGFWFEDAGFRALDVISVKVRLQQLIIKVFIPGNYRKNFNRKRYRQKPTKPDKNGTRFLTLCPSRHRYHFRTTPTVVLQGVWLANAGFLPGDGIAITVNRGKLVIKKDPAYWQRHQQRFPRVCKPCLKPLQLRKPTRKHNLLTM